MQISTTPNNQPKLPSDQQSQQNSLQNQEQILSYNEYSRCQENQITLATTCSLIKDLDFKSQKFFFLKIIGIFIIWSLISFLLFYLLGLCFKQTNKPFSCILSILSIIVTILLMRMGIRFKNRIPQKSRLLFFTLLIFYTTAYSSFHWSLDLPQDNSMTVDKVIETIIILVIGGNFLVNIILMLYLIIERKRIHLLYVIAIYIALFGFLCLFYAPIVIFIPFGLPYTYCLTKTLQQILKGKFNLKQNEVIPGVIATYFGLFNTCNDQYRDL